MKVRWRDHVIMLVTIVAAISVAGYLLRMFNLSSEQIETIYAAPFVRNQVPFNYYRNILLPQIGSVLLLYVGYLSINLFIVPLLKKLLLKETGFNFFKRIAFIALLILSISYLLALGINVAGYYAHPHYFNYGGFKVLAMFGYNNQPLTNLFAGFDRSIPIITGYSLLAFLREAIIQHIERSGVRKSYRSLIANQVTAFLVVYFSIFFFLATFNLVSDGILAAYLIFIPPAFLVFISNMYWLFPIKSEKSLLNFPVLARLLLSTFICTFPFLIFLKGQPPAFLIGWGIQLFIVTPISWLLYQQRKDKILQLRGVEVALEKSKADLQFLRSQINPHFLFNTLNTLYGTALKEGSQHTAEGIQKLGDMMRFMLHENNLDFIPISKEIEYLNNYIALQKLRTQSSANIHIEHSINEQHCNYTIAPMLLIPFVENAFKHGISLTKKSWIKIKLACDDKNICFEVRNSIHAGPNNNPEKEHSGIGLNNVIERLKLLYAGKHQITVGADNNEYLVSLAIQPQANIGNHKSNR